MRTDRPTAAESSVPGAAFATGAMKKPAKTEAQVVKKMHPGQPGTLKHVRQWGEALVCVRHRHDLGADERLTTVEVVVDRMPIQHHSDKRVSVRVSPYDLDTGVLLLAAGGTWNARTRLWQVSPKVAKALDLTPIDNNRLGPKK